MHRDSGVLHSSTDFCLNTLEKLPSYRATQAFVDAPIMIDFYQD